MSPFLAEFIGTMLLVLLCNGVVANVLLERTKGHAAGWIVITFGWGMAVFVGVLCVADISGAHLNPAVTVGLAAAGRFTGSVSNYIAAQMLGGVAGAALVFWLYYDHYAASSDADAKLATFATAPAIRRTSSNLLSEVVGTALLVFAGLMAVDPSFGEPSQELGLGALGALPTGLVVLAIGLSLGGTTGYAINPARDLGPRIAHAILPVPGKRDSDWSYSWIPVLGPVAGAFVAAWIYGAIT
jgi:glycerol uptake facilitator protein